MLTVADVLAAVESIAPARWAFPNDKVGLQIGDPAAPVTRAAFSLDSSLAAARYAAENRCQLLVAHHPLLYHPLENLRPGNHDQNTALELIKNSTAFIAAHTNWDAAPGGINDTLADRLNLTEIHSFGYANPQPQAKLVVFTPESALQPLLTALAEAGAGQIGDYTRCAFFQEGTGTFIPGPTTNPTTGRRGVVETTREVRVEMVVPLDRLPQIRHTIQAHHPYEEPAYDVVLLQDDPGQPAGRLGTLPQPLAPAALQTLVDAKLGCRSQMWLPESSGPIANLAVVGGAAAGEWKAAQKAGAQAFLTGEVPQHIALEAAEAGLVIFAAGHYHTEHPGVVALAKQIRTLTNLDALVYEPDPGQNGRPL